MKKVLSWVWLVVMSLACYSLFVLVVDSSADRSYYESFMHVTGLLALFLVILFIVFALVCLSFKAIEEARKK